VVFLVCSATFHLSGLNDTTRFIDRHVELTFRELAVSS